METQDLIKFICQSEKKTPVKVYIKEREAGLIDYGSCRIFGVGDKVVFGDWKSIKDFLIKNADNIEDMIIENYCRNSAVPLLDLKDINARIEPGAIIREHVKIGNNAVVMMGAIINIGAQVGEGSMIDMGAVLGAKAIVGNNCHIGAGAVIAGVVEPPSALPVVIENDVMIGANAVVIEGCRIGRGAVIAAGAVVTGDVPPMVVMAGVPARLIKAKDEKTRMKSELIEGLRNL